MKFLLDILPVVVFFATYKLGYTQAAWGLRTPIETATALALLIAFAQIAVLLARRRKIDLLQWLVFGLLLLTGGMTLLFHDPVFIYWKPTLVSLLLAVAMPVSRYGFGKHPFRALLEKSLAETEPTQPAQQLSNAAWDGMLWLWVGLCLLQAAVCALLAVAVIEGRISEDTWTNSKLILAFAAPVLFALVLGLWFWYHIAGEGRQKRTHEP